MIDNKYIHKLGLYSFAKNTMQNGVVLFLVTTQSIFCFRYIDITSRLY